MKQRKKESLSYYTSLDEHVGVQPQASETSTHLCFKGWSPASFPGPPAPLPP